tara:strand:+ start:2942 stop:3607 length:666 start_codon:yes stop_codon:yes gene_type:complete
MAIIEPMDNYSYRPIKGKNLARGRALNFAEAEYGAPRPSRVQGRTSVAPNYADIDAASFGALASGNAPSLNTLREGSPYAGGVIHDRSFGDPRTMMNSAIQNAMTKMRLGVQRSDLTADTAMTLGDIGRYAARDREGLIDRLNARNVFNSGIKEKTLGRSVGDEVRYKGRTMNQALRGLRDLSLAGDEADFSEFQTNVNSMLSDADQIRANMASKIKEFSV